MADLSDVSALLSTMVGAAVFPNGPNAASVTGAPVVYGPGWPQPKSLDDLIAAGGSNVSVFPAPGAATNVFQVLDEQYVLVPAVHGMTAAINGAMVTFNGQPGTGEYGSIVVDGRHAYSRVGASATAIVQAIAIDAAPNYAVTVSGNTITFPTDRLIARIGAPATMGSVTHRQKQQFIITVWSPNPVVRDALAVAIDVSFKTVKRLTMPDTSQAILVYDHTRQFDEKSAVSIYRRDLVYTVEYATLRTFTAWEVTSVNPTIDNGALSSFAI